jgi:hypothetical protein
MTTIAERLRTNPAIPEEMALMDEAADALDAAETALECAADWAEEERRWAESSDLSIWIAREEMIRAALTKLRGTK